MPLYKVKVHMQHSFRLDEDVEIEVYADCEEDAEQKAKDKARNEADPDNFDAELDFTDAWVCKGGVELLEEKEEPYRCNLTIDLFNNNTQDIHETETKN